MLNKVANDIKALVELGVQVAIVVGGQLLARPYKQSMDRATADLGNAGNGDQRTGSCRTFEANGIPTRVQTAIEMWKLPSRTFEEGRWLIWTGDRCDLRCRHRQPFSAQTPQQRCGRPKWKRT